MGIAMDERTWTVVHQCLDLGRTGDVEICKSVERLRQAISECVRGNAHERCTPVAASRSFVRQPSEVAVGLEPRRFPEARMQRRELLDDVACAVFDVVVGRRGKSAAARFEVFEHHDVLLAVGIGKPHARDAQGHI